MDHFVEQDQRIRGYLYQMFEAWWSNNGIRYTSQITHRTRGIGFQIWFSIKCCQMVPVWGSRHIKALPFAVWSAPGVDRSAEKVGLPGGHTQQQTASAVLWKRAGARLRHRECWGQIELVMMLRTHVQPVAGCRWDPTCLNLERKRKDARACCLILSCPYM